MTRALVIDDEPQIVPALRVNLRARGYDVDAAPDATTGLALAAKRPPDVVILDLGLPDMDGSEVIAGLRGWSTAPIIVLTGRTDQPQKIAALYAGADDYVTKPFDIEELFARMRAVARRATGDGGEFAAEIGCWIVELATHRIRPRDRAGPDLQLTPTEWRILELLVRHPGRLVTQRQLLTEVRGPPTRRRPTTSGSTWPSSAASSNPTRPDPTRAAPGPCSPTPGWATGSHQSAHREQVVLMRSRTQYRRSAPPGAGGLRPPQRRSPGHREGR